MHDGMVAPIVFINESYGVVAEGLRRCCDKLYYLAIGFNKRGATVAFLRRIEETPYCA